jgi:hypothetical protein
VQRALDSSCPEIRKGKKKRFELMLRFLWNWRYRYTFHRNLFTSFSPKGLCRKKKHKFTNPLKFLWKSYNSKRPLGADVVSGLTDEPRNLTSYVRREAKNWCTRALWLW